MSCFFSIIIPIYNVEVFLLECLSSVRDQTYQNFEAILINDGSTDGSVSIASGFCQDSRFVVLNQGNRGLSSSRNLGLSVAKGRYIIFLDSDDILSTSLLQVLYEKIEMNKNLDLICFNHALFDSNSGRSMGQSCIKPQLLSKNCQDLLFNKSISTMVCDKCFRKSVLRGMRFPDGQLFEDTAFLLESLYKSSEVLLINFVGYYYRKNRSGAITSSELLQYEKALKGRYDSVQNFKSIILINSTDLASEIVYAKQFKVLNIKIFLERIITSLRLCPVNFFIIKNILSEISVMFKENLLRIYLLALKVFFRHVVRNIYRKLKYH